MRAPTFTEIGERIRALREQKGSSQSDLAEAIGVSRQVATKIENGKKAINSVELANISMFLGVSVDILTQPIVDDTLVARFRQESHTHEFAGGVERVERMFRSMIAQLEIRREWDGSRR